MKIGVLTCFMSVCHLGETKTLKLGKNLEGYSWWKKISLQRPAFADRFLREQKDQDIGTPVCSVAPVNALNDPTSWQAFASECKGNSGVMDSACNKSMIGESTLQALESIWKKKFGLGIQRLPAEEGESFKLADAEVVEVKERKRSCPLAS